MAKKQRLIVAVVALLLGTAPLAVADPGGAPHDNSCGVGTPGVEHFHSDPTLPGSSEIKTYPPVPWGCTGATKTP